MDLYLIRHADAVSLGEGGITDDAQRPLTRQGEEQAKHLAHGLQRRGIRLGLVVMSPLLRARQTAEGMLKEWTGPPPELRISEELAPGGKRRRLSRFVKDLGTDSVALVGHQPDLGEYLVWLIGSKKGQIDLAKAGVASIQVDDKVKKGSGTLNWLVTPEWLVVGG